MPRVFNEQLKVKGQYNNTKESRIEQENYNQDRFRDTWDINRSIEVKKDTTRL